MKTLLIPSIMLALAGTIALTANPSGGEKRQALRPPPSPVVLALDTNNDGALSPDEIAHAAQALLTLDKNGDGKVDQEEMRPARPDNAPGGDDQPPGPPRRR